MSTPTDYEKAALRTLSDKRIPVLGPAKTQLLHAAMGLVTESGEFIDPIKKHLFYGKAISLHNLLEELGDIQWYVAVAISAINVLRCAEASPYADDIELMNLDDVQAMNIEKLKARFVEKFTADEALNRDTDAELEAMQ